MKLVNMKVWASEDEYQPFSNPFFSIPPENMFSRGIEKELAENGLTNSKTTFN